VDRVQVIKQESAALGGDDADTLPFDAPIEPQEDAIEAAGYYGQDASNRDETTLIWRDGANWKFKDQNNPTGFTLTQLGAAGSGISEGTHKTLLQLIHFIDEGPAEGFTSGATKTVTGGLFPTKIEWKRQDTTLLVEKTITRSGGSATLLAPTPIVWKVFDTDGTTVLATVSDTITYSGVTEVSRVRTIS
jgi:hypothetical protein